MSKTYIAAGVTRDNKVIVNRVIAETLGIAREKFLNHKDNDRVDNVSLNIIYSGCPIGFVDFNESYFLFDEMTYVIAYIYPDTNHVLINKVIAVDEIKAVSIIFNVDKMGIDIKDAIIYPEKIKNEFFEKSGIVLEVVKIGKIEMIK